MAEVLAGLGASAAFFQLLRYGAAILEFGSGLRRRVRYAPQTIQAWNDKVAAHVLMIEQFQSQLKNSEDMKLLSEQCRGAATELRSVLAQLASVRQGSDGSKLKAICFVLCKEKETDRIISSLTGTLTTLQLNLLMLHTRRIENCLQPLYPNLFNEAAVQHLDQIAQRPVFRVQHPRNGKFIGYKSVMETMHQLIRPGGLQHRISMCGISGIGKTEIAAEFSYQLRDSRPEESIFWLNGINEATLLREFLELSYLLKVQNTKGNPVDDLRAVVAHLLSPGVAPWLIVIDNVDLDTFFGSHQLHRYIPVNDHGCVLILTRSQQCASKLVHPSELVQLSGMIPSDARDLLLSVTHGLHNEVHLNDLLSQLEYHPLAITQAGSTIKSQGISVDEYLHQLNMDDEQPVELLLPIARSHQSYARNSIQNVGISGTSLSYPNQTQQFTERLLITLSCFHPANIPMAAVASHFGQGPLSEALAILQSYLFIRPGTETNTIGLHPFIRSIARSELRKSEDCLLHIDAAIFMIDAIFPAEFALGSRLERCHTFEKHVTAVVHIAISMISTIDADKFPWSRVFSICMRLCMYLHCMGQHSRAKDLIEKVRHKYSSPTTFDSKTDTFLAVELAVVQAMQKELATALESSWNVLLSQVHTLREADTRTLRSLNSIGVVYHSMGAYEEAEKSHRKVLELKIDRLGHGHLETLTSTINFSVLLQSSDDDAVLEATLRQSLSASLRIFDPDDLHIATINTTLAINLKEQGRLDEAEEMHRIAHQHRLRLLGPKHHETLKSEGNIAITINEKGQHREAETLYRSILAVFEAMFGLFHPSTLQTYFNLTLTLHDQGRFCEAEGIMADAIPKISTRFGVGHSKTIGAMDFQKRLLYLQGKEMKTVTVASIC